MCLFVTSVGNVDIFKYIKSTQQNIFDYFLTVSLKKIDKKNLPDINNHYLYYYIFIYYCIVHVQ